MFYIQRTRMTIDNENNNFHFRNEQGNYLYQHRKIKTCQVENLPRNGGAEKDKNKGWLKFHIYQLTVHCMIRNCRNE